MKIAVEYCSYAPRSEAFSAYDADTYDCDCNENGFFSTSPVGVGATQEEAIRALLDLLADKDKPLLTQAELNHLNGAS